MLIKINQTKKFYSSPVAKFHVSYYIKLHVCLFTNMLHTKMRLIFANILHIRLVSLLNSRIATEKNILRPTTDFVSTVISVDRGAKEPKSKEN